MTSRLERAREELRRSGAVGVALAPGANLRHAAGWVVAASERLLLLLLAREGDPVLVAPAFEIERLVAGSSEPIEPVAWTDGADPFALAAERMAAEAGALPAGAFWLLDAAAPFWVAEGLEMRGIRLRSAGGLCATLRRRKDAAEVELLTRAQALTRDAVAGLARELEPGLTERELAGRVVEAFRAAGADGWALVQFGEGSASPHGEPGDRALREDSAVLVDAGAVVEGYHGDLTRSWWFGGRAPARYAEVAAAVERAQAVAAELAAPGKPAQELDRAARRYLAARGLGPSFVHRLGHGIGLEIHEEPYIVEGNAAALEAGDVFTIEPGAYLPGAFGVRHEDVWLVEERGARRL